MATVSSHQQSAFTAPTNGTTLDADEVRGNDEANRAQHNAHDSDALLHIQSSALADRPAAGTASRMWLTTDDRKLWVDTGSAWLGIAYISSAGGTITGNLIVDGALIATGAGGFGSVGSPAQLQVHGNLLALTGDTKVNNLEVLNDTVTLPSDRFQDPDAGHLAASLDKTPTGATTDTNNKWLAVRDAVGVIYYIPAWASGDS